MKKKVLVFGATGQQGGSVAHELLKDEKWRVRAFTRNKNSEKAKSFASKGAEVYEGDTNDVNTIRRAMKGCYGVFLITADEEGTQKEIVNARNVMKVALEFGIGHFVLTTGYGVSREEISGIPHVDSKAILESYLVGCGLLYTIVRPGYFYTSFKPSLVEIMKICISEEDINDFRLETISVENIGKYVATAFNNPGKWMGKTVHINDEQLAIPEIAAALGCKWQELSRSQGDVSSKPYLARIKKILEWQETNSLPTTNFKLLEELAPNVRKIRFKDWARGSRESLSVQNKSKL